MDQLLTVDDAERAPGRHSADAGYITGGAGDEHAELES
jgi:hypothetical protein